MPQVRKVYFNKMQRYIMSIAASVTVAVCGRRFGKSHGINAPWLLRNVQAMPGASMGIVGASFQQLLTRTLPSTLKGLETMGYRRNIHYVVGKKPPPSLDFAKPYIEPVSYERVISWYNGSIQYLISQDIPGSSNSLTLQGIMGDEAKLLNFDKLKDETFPANGGFQGPWRDCPWLNSMLFTSDMPSGKRGSWFMNYEDQMDVEVISYIEGLITKIYQLKAQEQNSYTRKQIAHYQKELAYWRSNAVHYIEASSIENVELLGAKYIAQQKRDLPPLIFQTSILSRKPGKQKGTFYEALNPALHYYTAYDNSYLLDLNYNFEEAQKESCLQDGDLQRDKPICVAFDYNANINWLVAGQAKGGKMLVLKSFYVKYERKLRELVDDFCEYYRHHYTKDVIFYFDQTALGSNYAVSDDDFRSVIQHQFEKNGWSVTAVHIGQAPRHTEKHLMINQALQGQNNYLYIQLNETQNEALILALELAGLSIGRNGWQKDKAGEKLAETEEDKLEHRTDGTDAFDTLFIGMNKFPQANNIILYGGSVR